MRHRYGTFCFAELITPSVARAVAFYAKVFGWSATPIHDGVALFRQADGQVTGGVRETPDAGTHWIPYVAVRDLEESIDRAQRLGGLIDQPPMSRPGQARTVTVHDVRGSVFGLWQSQGSEGVDVQNDPGAMWWVELLTRDTAATRWFYQELFGWTATERRFAHLAHPYYVFKAGDESAAGVGEIEKNWGAVKERWQIFWAVADDAATMHTATAAGGSIGFTVAVPGVATLAQLSDPDGAGVVIAKPIAR